VALSLPLGIQSIIGFVMGGAVSVSLILLIAFVIVGVFLSGLLKVNQMKLTERVQQQLFMRYSFQYAESIPNLNLLHVNKYSLPELSNRFFDVVSLQKSLSKLLLDIPAATIQILFGLILLSFYHPFFISFGILLLLSLFVIIRYTGNKGLHTSLQVSDHKYKVANYLQELSRTIFNLKFVKRPDWTLTKADNFIFNYLTARTSHFKILMVQYWTLIAFKVIIVSSMLIVGSYLLINQQLNIGQFIATEIVIMSIVESIEKLVINLDKVYDTLTSVEKINKLIDIQKDTEGNADLKLSNAPSIKTQQLSFSYKDEEWVLRDMNINISSGEKVCLMGNTGSGKSTLLKLISGLYEIKQGNIFINDIPIGNFEPAIYRRSISVMLGGQDIFEGTIKDNICLGVSDISEEQLYKYADITGLRTYIEKCKKGFEQWIIPMSNHLPEITTRKIMLTRALIHKTPLLLLEHPWQGLEDLYATRVKEYLLTACQNATVIIVTNDQQFADKCSKVITLGKA
jgi:ABC-type bacteriocin/lantibiotic exporter with double-glycine peptidase domain